MENKNKILLLRRVLTELGFNKEINCKKVTEAIDKGISTFMKNPYFAEAYESIPTEMLKCHELLVWANSVDHAKGTVDELQEAVKEALNLEEWQWLIDNTPNITAKICWSKILKAKQLEKELGES